MIRNIETNDVEKAAKIWLDVNQKAHGFIPSAYWENHFERVKEMFFQTAQHILLPTGDAPVPNERSIFVFENADHHEIEGFIGVCSDYIEGIFVLENAQSHGIGTQLISFAKSLKKQLSLHVYQKNTRAIKFYQKEQFQIQTELTDENTEEQEYLMTWKR